MAIPRCRSDQQERWLRTRSTSRPDHAASRLASATGRGAGPRSDGSFGRDGGHVRLGAGTDAAVGAVAPVPHSAPPAGDARAALVVSGRGGPPDAALLARRLAFARSIASSARATRELGSSSVLRPITQPRLSPTPPRGVTTAQPPQPRRLRRAPRTRRPHPGDRVDVADGCCQSLPCGLQQPRGRGCRGSGRAVERCPVGATQVLDLDAVSDGRRNGTDRWSRHRRSVGWAVQSGEGVRGPTVARLVGDEAHVDPTSRGHRAGATSKPLTERRRSPSARPQITSITRCHPGPPGGDSE